MTKRKIMGGLLTLAMAGTLALAPGCASLQDQNKLAGYLADAKDVAFGASTIVLLQADGDAQARVNLAKAAASLDAITTLPEGQVTVADLLLVLSKLPVDQLQSEKAQVILVAGRILVRRFVDAAGAGTFDVGANGAVRQFAAAFRDGINMALASR